MSSMRRASALLAVIAAVVGAAVVPTGANAAAAAEAVPVTGTIDAKLVCADDPWVQFTLALRDSSGGAGGSALFTADVGDLRAGGVESSMFVARYPGTSVWEAPSGSTGSKVEWGIAARDSELHASGVFTTPRDCWSPFVDVSPTYQFIGPIAWMNRTGITRGYVIEEGVREFQPWGFVTRDAMAAFLYRFAGATAPAPATSPFVDVSKNDPFYKEIAWLAEAGISKGWGEGSKKEFRPYEPITRDAMAAFLDRYMRLQEPTPPAVSPFADVSTDNPFYREISGLDHWGISTGWTVGGTREFRPYENITRDAMAAFLFRASKVMGSG